MSTRARILTTVLLLLALPWAIYAPARHGPFVFDDRSAVLEITANYGHQALAQSLQFWGDGRTSYRPLRFASYWMDWRAGDGAPEPFHRTNTLLHCINGILLLWLLRRFRVPTGIAVAAALLFCVHPIQTQAVAYISGRKDLLGAVFYLLALHATLSASRSRGFAGRLLGGAGFCVAAAASFQAKEIALTLPLAALLVDTADTGFMGGDGSPPARLWRLLRRRPVFYGAMTLAGGAGLFIKLVVKPGTKVPVVWSELPQNLPLVCQSLALHVRKLLWPWPQLADSRGLFPVRLEAAGAPPVDMGQFWNGGGLWATLLGLALVVALIALAAHSHRRGPALGGLAFFALALTPMLNLVRLNEPAAEHYLYLPTAGGALLLAAVAAPWLDTARSRGRVWTLLPVAVLVALGLAAWSRTPVWSAREHLWENTAQVNPTNARAWSNLGLLRLEAGDVVTAGGLFRRALLLEPGLTRAAANLMTVLEQEGDLDGALEVGAAALTHHPDDPLLISYQGRLLLTSGRAAAALPMLERVAGLRDGPELAIDSWACDRCLAQLMTGDIAGAEQCLREATTEHPHDPTLWSNLGLALLELGRVEEAADALQRAVSLPDASGTAHRNLAVALYRLERHREAWTHIERARALGETIPPSFEAAVREALAGRREEQ